MIAHDKVVAKLKNIRISHRKVDAIVGIVRKTKVSDALIQLTFSKSRAGYILKKLISSAVANAENNHNINSDTLLVETVDVGPGNTLKRVRPRARGRASQIKHRSSNIRVVLSVTSN